MWRDRDRPGRPLTLAAATLAAATLTAACSASAGHQPAATFTPGAPASGTAAAAGPASSGGTGADDFVMPPFGGNVRVAMTDWLPAAGSRLIPAVVTMKNFFLAFYYAQYKGGHDHRWAAYVSGTAQPAVAQSLQAPDVAGQSFTGAMSFGAMSAAADPKLKGDVDVRICVDTSHLTDTYLPSGKVEPTQPPPSQDDYTTTAYLAKGSTGQWYVVGLRQSVSVPVAKGCTS
jgi:hypothetical protein